jgi:hypothetical protein
VPAAAARLSPAGLFEITPQGERLARAGHALESWVATGVGSRAGLAGDLQLDAAFVGAVGQHWVGAAALAQAQAAGVAVAAFAGFARAFAYGWCCELVAMQAVGAVGGAGVAVGRDTGLADLGVGLAGAAQRTFGLMVTALGRG